MGEYQDNSTLVNTTQPAISFTRQGESLIHFDFQIISIDESLM